MLGDDGGIEEDIRGHCLRVNRMLLKKEVKELGKINCRSISFHTLYHLIFTISMEDMVVHDIYLTNIDGALTLFQALF